MPVSHPTILVAAGTNGAGKSSIVEPFVARAVEPYFNPDSYARSLVKQGLSLEEANALAWTKGYERLCAAVENNSGCTLETTLGGHSIAFQLMRALAFGRRVTILYVGLASVDLHMQRVRARVARGGHDIPEDKIRQRYEDSRKNLLSFIGTSATIRVWDNSEQTEDGRPSAAREVFRVERRRVVLPDVEHVGEVPTWARPLLAQALKLKLPTRQPR